MRDKFYQAFTLVEMLIVMGILIILMVIGVAAGRFAINRANDVAHQNAADQIYVALQAYYTDERRFPTNECEDGGGDTVTCTAQNLIGTPEELGLLGERGFLDVGSWNGGSDATYLYLVGGDNGDQAVLICVSLRGTAQEQSQRTGEGDNGMWYCAGNGFNLADLSSSDGVFSKVITEQLMEGESDIIPELNGLSAGSDWTKKTWE